MPPSEPQQSGIGPIFVINLDRQPDRWSDVRRELACILDAADKPLSERAVRYSACDAQTDAQQSFDGGDIEPYYTLGDQLFVEPQPHALPDAFDLARPIRMSPAEVAVARSHVAVWKIIAQSIAAYSLVLEDDVWFRRGFGRVVDRAWREMEDADRTSPAFDVLYLSYREVRYGAPKELVSKNVFSPGTPALVLSGYVLSKKGAQALLGLLPCRGPIDLWINHKFGEMDVRALCRSVINQRLDRSSTNSYSILPALNRIGVLDDCDAALFHHTRSHSVGVRRVKSLASVCDRVGPMRDPVVRRWQTGSPSRRAVWNPTPIPHLPMTLHVNTWPTRSRELAGRLAFRALPASAIVRSIAVDALNAGA